MRLTFPTVSPTSPYSLLFQAALTCLPITVAFVAERLFGHTKLMQNVPNFLRGLGAVSIVTLAENKWARRAGLALWVMFEAYRYHYPFVTAQINQVKPLSKPDKKQYYWETHNILNVASQLMSHIEEKGIEEKGIYRLSGADKLLKEDLQALDSLLSTTPSEHPGNLDGILDNIKKYQFIHTPASILKGLFKRLKTPLLQPIAETLHQISANKKHPNKNAAYREALSTLPHFEQELAHITIRHLGHIAKQSKTNHMTSENLARIFMVSFFEIADRDYLTAPEKIKNYTSALADLIENYQD